MVSDRGNGLIATHAHSDRAVQALLALPWASAIADLWLTVSGQPQIAPFVCPIALIAMLAMERSAGATAQTRCTSSSRARAAYPWHR